MTLAGKLAVIAAAGSEIGIEGAYGLGWHAPAALVLGVVATELIARSVIRARARERLRRAREEMVRHRAIFSSPPLSDEEAEVVAAMRADGGAK